MNMAHEISVFKCNRCYREWDDFEDERTLRLKKCSICHSEICKSCFYNKNNKQHCLNCYLKITPKNKNMCIINRNNFVKK